MSGRDVDEVREQFELLNRGEGVKAIDARAEEALRGTSRQTAAFVQRHYEAFNQRDLAGILADLDPEIEFAEDASARPDAASYRGLEAIGSYYTALWDAEEHERHVVERLGFWVEVDEVIEAGQQAVVGIRARGESRPGGIAHELYLFHVWTLREGKALRLRAYGDRSRALEAVGLRA